MYGDLLYCVLGPRRKKKKTSDKSEPVLLLTIHSVTFNIATEREDFIHYYSRWTTILYACWGRGGRKQVIPLQPSNLPSSHLELLEQGRKRCPSLSPRWGGDRWTIEKSPACAHIHYPWHSLAAWSRRRRMSDAANAEESSCMSSLSNATEASTGATHSYVCLIYKNVIGLCSFPVWSFLLFFFFTSKQHTCILLPVCLK